MLQQHDSMMIEKINKYDEHKMIRSSYQYLLKRKAFGDV